MNDSRQDGLGIASLITAIISIISSLCAGGCALPFTIVATILVIIAGINAYNKKTKPSDLTIAAIILTVLSYLVDIFLLYLPGMLITLMGFLASLA